MPRGIYIRTKDMKTGKNMLGKKHSIETIMKMRGHVPWNKGVTGYMGANETSFKNGDTAPKTAFKKGHIPWIKGKHPVAWNKGKKLDKEKYPNMGFRGGYYQTPSGKENTMWKGGITSTNMKIRSSVEYKLWVDSVFARDGYTCQKTGQVGWKLVAHHILTFAEYPELRFAIDNGITLSVEVHKQFHKKYGRKNNTREQLEEFLLP